MSDLIKSITTISVNDVLEEAFETAVEATPTNNDFILSYNPDSKVIGKSAFPADVTTIANEAKTQADAAQEIADATNVAAQQLSIDLAPSKITSFNAAASNGNVVIDFSKGDNGQFGLDLEANTTNLIFTGVLLKKQN